MQTAAGKSIGGGIAIGKIKIWRASRQEISREPVADPQAETGRFDAAAKKAAGRQMALYEKALDAVGEDGAGIFRAHAMLLEDTDLTGAVHEIIVRDRCCAEYAVKQTFDRLARIFSQMEDPSMKARGADLSDVGQELLDVLTEDARPESPGAGAGHSAPPEEPAAGASMQSPEKEPYILAGEDFTPSDMVRLDKSGLLGIITRRGSILSHAAILARSMNLPSLIQCEDLSGDWDGKMAVLDGSHSCVYLDPTDELLAAMAGRMREESQRQALLRDLKGQPSTTRDGVTVSVDANIDGPSDIGAVQDNDAEGVGLFRSEYLYLDSGHSPTEEEQFEAYRLVVQTLAPRPVVIRTCDIGVDKKADYMELEPEENPALGFRAVRLCLARKDFFKTQLRALLRSGAYGNLRILFPMITSLGELKECRLLLEECRTELTAEGKKTGRPGVGIMIETPAAVLCADELARFCDFFSIGTNDLAQYICAADRQNARLESCLDPHHPAVLKAIRMTIEAGHRQGIRVGICGELAADLTLTESFLRMGCDAFSVSPGSILPLRRQIRNLDLSRSSPDPGQSRLALGESSLDPGQSRLALGESSLGPGQK